MRIRRWLHAQDRGGTVHALRSVTAKLPERHRREVKARWWRVFDEAASRGEQGASWALASDYRGTYPSRPR